MSYPKEKYHFSWGEYGRAVDQLVADIEASGQDYSAIVGISRGGLVVATMLSHRLCERHGLLPVYSVSVTSYDDGQQRIPPMVAEGSFRPTKPGKFLIVDDIIDEGKTAEVVYNYITSGSSQATVVAVLVRPQWESKYLHGAVVPDEVWVVFPYEIDPEETAQRRGEPGGTETAAGIVESPKVLSRRWVTVRTSFQGIHCWPAVPFEEVSFLKHPHRHVFQVKVDVELPMAQDRQIEFFMLQAELQGVVDILYGPKPATAVMYRLADRSCETIAQELIGVLKRSPLLEPALAIRATVSEDGENGATVETLLR